MGIITAGPRMFWIGVLRIALFVFPGLLLAQLPSSLSGKAGGTAADLGSLYGRSAGAEIPATGAFFEGAVDSNDYVVGPGDLFRIFYWKPTYNELPARVSAEGDLAIPIVGLVRVADLTLAEAKRRVSDAVARSFRYGEVGLSLIEPRKFRVHVTGLVGAPGSYVVSATARVADALELAGGLKREFIPSGRDTSWTVVASRRNIELRNRGGVTVGHADLMLFQQGGESRANPLLRDGWTIYVPAKPTSEAMVSVTGAVGSPGEFEFVPGDHLRELIAVAGGLTTAAERKSVRIVNASGRSVLADLSQESATGWSEQIAAGDRILVGAIPDTSTAGAVTIEGEVLRPGGYPIVDGKTTVRELLELAGGLTPQAVARSARLVRNPNYIAIEPEPSRISSGNISEGAPGPIFMDAALYAEFSRWDYGTVVLDLNAAEGAEVVVRNGDRLVVPKSPLGVRVLGSVKNAGEVVWQDDRRLADYMEAAGGKAKGAWTQRAVVIRAKNGSQVRYSKSLEIDPGDLIYVPQRPYDLSAWTTFKDFLTVAAQVATVVLVIQQAAK